MQSPHAHDGDVDGDLISLRADFPSFRIWCENVVGRVRYVARRLDPSIHPHTVVTADPAEVRAALSAGPEQRPAYVAQSHRTGRPA
jgi:hypothetical protein